MSKDDEEREARFKAIQEENEMLKRNEKHRKEADQTERDRQAIIRQQAKENSGSGEKAIFALIAVIVLGILLSAE